MFIKLTRWIYNLSYDTAPEEIWVNPANITHIQQLKRRRVTALPNSPGVPTLYSEEELVTCISFTAGLHEESDAINVIETPQEISREIGYMQSGYDQ